MREITITLLDPDITCFEISLDPDQLAVVDQDPHLCPLCF